MPKDKDTETNIIVLPDKVPVDNVLVDKESVDKEPVFFIESSVVPHTLERPSIDDFNVCWINNVCDCDKAVDLLCKESIIALDLEADNMFHYKNQLCVIQVATLDAVYLFDPIAISSGKCFQPLLGESGPVKLIHDAAFDVRLLYDYGVTPGNIFDTCLASKFLGEQAVGLSTLLLKYFGVKLNKEFQCIDWSLRPLNEKKMQYLVCDVIYLMNLYTFLSAAVADAEIEEEINEELHYISLCAEDDLKEKNLPLWAKIKGWKRLKRKQLNVLKVIAEIRDVAAAKKDLPPSRIIKNKTMISIAKKIPDDLKSLKKIDRFNSSGRQILQLLLDVIIECKTSEFLTSEDLIVFNEAQRPRQTKTEATRTKGLKKYLKVYRDEQAKERDVDAQVVIPGHCLKEICHSKPCNLEELAVVRGFGEKRLKLYGNEILEIVQND